MFPRQFLSLCIAIFSFFAMTLVSCERLPFSDEDAECGKFIDLADSVYYAKTNAASTIYSTATMEFEKLDTHESRNLEKLCGRNGGFVWLKIEFEVPKSLRYRSLGFVVSYLRFADRVWLNNYYIGSYGKFPPNEKSSLFESHCYFFPDNAVRNDGVNTILVKVWTHGRSEISDGIFISDYDTALHESNKYSFLNSKIYLIFEGAMFCSFILYLMTYLWRRKNRAHLAFALLNLSTIIFLLPLLAPEIPFYLSDSLSYLLFIKITLCVSFYFLVSLVSYFIFKFFDATMSKPVQIFFHCALLIPTLITIFVPSYNALILLFKPFIITMILQLGIGVYKFVVCLFNENTRRRALIMLVGFSHVIVCILLDIVMSIILKDTANPYFSILGWQLTIIAFIAILTMQHSKVYSKNEYLTENLRLEVAIQTKALTKANEELVKQSKKLEIANEILEREMTRNMMDLDMAAIVQQKFFPPPDKVFRGWDIAICYQPAAKVSGDLYDYYALNENLQGFSIFDVSGHGISSGLITMLSKRIIFNTFKESLEKFRSVSDTLYKVNEQIIEAKGDIENYLTGLLLQFSEFNDDDSCDITMANAGHPHPLLYSSASNLVSEVVNADASFNQYGAIGINGIAVSFPEIKFKMFPDDIFVCFTDGLLESFNKNREEYGVERLKKVIERSSAMDSQSILEDIIDDLMLFSSGVPRDDDLTIIILKRKRSGDYVEEILEEL